MAAIDFHKPSSAFAEIAHHALELPRRIANSFREWNYLRSTRNTLSRLSDRELDDIGISRCEIERVAREHLHR